MMRKYPIITAYQPGDMGRISRELTQAAWIFYDINQSPKPRKPKDNIIHLAFRDDKDQD